MNCTKGRSSPHDTLHDTFIEAPRRLEPRRRRHHAHHGGHQAAQRALDQAKELGGEGGLIAIDKNGEIALPFNSNGMYRGYVDPTGKFVVEIYK